MTNNTKVVKSLVKVYFPERRITQSYFNDAFDLNVGDIVFVEGNFEGLRGRVEAVSRTFKIKKSDYKKVIAVADTDLWGEVLMAGDNMIALDKKVLPFEKVRGWFLPPVSEEDEEYEIFFGEEEEILPDQLEKMKIDPVIRSRGEEYFDEGRIAYLELCGSNLRAIVLGSKPYEVTACFCNGVITELLCDCPYPDTCKHEYATLLFLKEAGKVLAEEYDEDLDFPYLAIMPKSVFVEYTILNKKRGSLNFD